MKEDELYYRLSLLNTDIFVLNRPDVNPLEIILLTRNKRLVNRVAHPISVVEDEKKRFIKVFSLSELGIDGWYKHLTGESQVIEKNVYKLKGKIGEVLLLLTCYYHSSLRNSYVINNIEKYFRDKYSIIEEKELNSFFNSYIRDEDLHYYVRFITDDNNENVLSLSKIGRLQFRLNRLLLRAKRRLPIICLSFMGKYHCKFARKKYISYLKKKRVLYDGWSILTDSNGSTSSLLIKHANDDGTYFLKGNELYLYHSISTEIAVHTILRSEVDSSWFLEMTRYDKNKRWIEYPYAECKTLDKLLLERNLNESELHKLAEFFCYTIDRLSMLHISHNDIRPDNIMIFREKAMLRFVLIDFGCASINGISPWEKAILFKKYFTKSICGSYRYSDAIVDDASSAYLVYLEAGGKADSKDANALLSRIGKTFLISK